MPTHGGIVRVLAEDRELGGGLDPWRLAAATAEVGAAVKILDRGDWNEVRWPASVRRGAGLLVLDGLLLRYVEIEGRKGAELLGSGDLLRPWQQDETGASLPERSGWRVLSRSRVALLDVRFMERIADYPEIQGRLVERSWSRASRIAVAVAIVNQPLVDMRLRMMLWHLANRWGTARAEGVLIPRLSESVLGELIAASRPTVSSILNSMERLGEITRTPEGWLLHDPPAGAGPSP